MCSLPTGRQATHPVDIGEATEAVIVAALLRRGYSVLRPVGSNHRYDLVLDCDGRFLRVQCKTGRLRRGVIKFSTQSTRINTRGAHSRGYAGEVELFMVACPGTSDVYAVPAEEATGTNMCLRVEPTANNQANGIRWAADYVFGEVSTDRVASPCVPSADAATDRP